MSDRRRAAIDVAIVGAYVALVVVAARHHAMWRDEVRALSIATWDASVLDLLRRLPEDGHPAVWYLLLRWGHAVAGDAALPLVAGAIGVVAAALVVWGSPFPTMHRVLLVFGAYLAYEYSVMCRGYGVGMLVLFALAARYQWRVERPIVWGGLLAVLANTSVHAAICAVAFLAPWAWEMWRHAPDATGGPLPAPRLRPRAVQMGGPAIAVAGLAVAAISVMPPDDSIISPAFTWDAVYLAKAAVWSVFNPGDRLSLIVPLPAIAYRYGAPWWASPMIANAVLAGVAIGLRRHPPLLVALAIGTIASGLLYRIVYEPSFRHVGMVYMLIVALSWCAIGQFRGDQDRGTRQWLLAWLAVPMVLQLFHTWHLYTSDVDTPRSAARDFGGLLRTAPYDRAIVLGEPDYMLETLRYYAPNRLFYPRRGAFGEWTVFATRARQRFDLGALLASADSLSRAERLPILITLDSNLVTTDSGSVTYGYGTRFEWNAADRRVLLERTREVGRFLRGREERYVVREWLPAPGR